MTSKREEDQPLQRHLAAVQRHIVLMDEGLRQERERRKQIQPAAVAYQTLRQRLLALVLEDRPFSAEDIRRALEGLPRTLAG